MVRSFTQSLLVVILIFTLYAGPQQDGVSAADGTAELFQDFSGDQVAAPDEIGGIQSRVAVLNRSVLAQVKADGAPVHLSLFPQAQYSASFTRQERSVTGGSTLSGELLEILGSQVVFSFQDDQFYASIHTGSELYQVQSTAGDQVRIEQLNIALPGAELEPLEPDPTALDAAPAEMMVVSDDDGTRLDVLVVYTSTVAAAVGESNLLNRINTAVSESNLGYANSQMIQRVSLAGTMKVTWDEAGFDWSSALTKITSGATPFEGVRARRDADRADLVVLVVANTGSCGIGWLMKSASSSFESSAFTVVSNACLTGYYTFAHEQGHNEGAHHDRWTATGGYKTTETGLYPYSYGYWMRPNAGSPYTHRTIMAYDCYNYQGSGCTRVNYWSNPAVSYAGMPTGVAEGQTDAANNAKTLNNSAPVVAKFRDGLPPVAPTNLTAIDLSSTSFRLNWVDASADEAGFKVYRAPYNTTTWGLVGTLAAGTVSYIDSNLSAGVNYSYKVIAYSGNGVSSEVKVNAEHLLPAVPTGLAAVKASMIRINLTWVDASANEAGFEIERSPNGTSSWVKIATAGVNTTTYSDASLPCISPNPPTYYYRVRAYNTTGYSSYTPTSSSSTSVCTAPLSPSPLSYTSSLNAITLKWNNVDGETQFVIERETTPGTWIPLGTVGKDVVSYTSSGLTKGSAYKFRVKSLNSMGSSAFAEIQASTMFFGIYLPGVLK